MSCRGWVGLLTLAAMATLHNYFRSTNLTSIVESSLAGSQVQQAPLGHEPRVVGRSGGLTDQDMTPEINWETSDTRPRCQQSLHSFFKCAADSRAQGTRPCPAGPDSVPGNSRCALKIYSHNVKWLSRSHLGELSFWASREKYDVLLLQSTGAHWKGPGVFSDPNFHVYYDGSSQAATDSAGVHILFLAHNGGHVGPVGRWSRSLVELSP